jgi:hypothetical protein
MVGGYRLPDATGGYHVVVALQDARTRKTRTRAGFVRRNSLLLVCFGLFAIFVVGLLFTGFRNNNAEQRAHNQPELSLGEYATSGAFWEALTENWESEYLQMAAVRELAIPRLPVLVLSVAASSRGQRIARVQHRAGASR